MRTELKDFTRMQDLIVKDRDGKDVAAKIKSKEKAAARFVAGMKLLKVEPQRWDPWREYYCFYEKALNLGCTKEEILELYNNTTVPAELALHESKSYSGYAGSIERVLDKLSAEDGLEWKLITNNDYYKGWSCTTSHSYHVNGRCWPLNYYIVNNVGYKQYLVVVSNEGGGIYGYDFGGNRMQFRRIVAHLKEKSKEMVESL